MPARQESCCFTGHRPGKLPWRYDETDPRCLDLKRRIADAVEAAYDQGFRHFLCGMAQGCDLYFCECVLTLRQRHPDVTVEAAIPCPSQADGWPRDQRERYMVDHAALLIAAFDGTPGGTRYTVEYAMRRRIPIVDLDILPRSRMERKLAENRRV